MNILKKNSENKFLIDILCQKPSEGPVPVFNKNALFAHKNYIDSNMSYPSYDILLLFDYHYLP